MSSFLPGTILTALALLGDSSSTQRDPPANSLPRALSTFAAADLDRDARLSSGEARGLPVSAELFAAEDANHDGYWSRDEFLVFYRHQLLALGQQASPDLESEIARIHALKRVEAVASTRTAASNPTSQRIEKAIAELETKCAARRASQEDFQRLRNLVILNGRAPGPDAGQGAALRAIDAIEKRSLHGQFTKDDFASLRKSALANPVVPTGAETTRAQGQAAPALVGPADARQRAQSPKVEPQVPKPARPAPSPPPPARPAPKPKDKEAPDRSRP